jgi:hypothetical protein
MKFDVGLVTLIITAVTLALLISILVVVWQTMVSVTSAVEELIQDMKQKAHPFSLGFSIQPAQAQAANCKDENGAICFLPPTANYYNNVLQLYQYNGGPRWALELDQNHPPYNSGSKVVPTENGWYTNVGNQLNIIRNEISASPNYNQIRPWITLGGKGPYDQDQWRAAGFMHKQPLYYGGDWKNMEMTGIYYIPEGSQKAGQGPGSVDFVMRGGVNADQYPLTCQATNYHVAYAGFTGDDGGARIERDIEHTNGYCKGCINARDIPGYKNIPMVKTGQPFGYKVVLYNSVDGKKVRMDAYVDNSPNPGSHWQYMYSYVDDGNDPRIDSVRGSISCQGVRPELPINWGGSISDFRINWAGAEFRQLTIQSIDAPKF